MTAMTHRRGRGHVNLLPIDINCLQKKNVNHRSPVEADGLIIFPVKACIDVKSEHT